MGSGNITFILTTHTLTKTWLFWLGFGGGGLTKGLVEVFWLLGWILMLNKFQSYCVYPVNTCFEYSIYRKNSF